MRASAWYHFRPMLAYLVFPMSVMLFVVWQISRIRYRRRAVRSRNRMRAGCCVKCGYDLRGSPMRCPECGTEPDVTNFARFTDRARTVTEMAHNAAGHAGQTVVRPQHVLAAIAAEGRDTGASLLGAMGVDCKAVVARLSPGLSPDEPRRTNKIVDPQSYELVRLAWAEARSIGDNYVGTHHFVLALLAMPDALPSDLFAPERVNHSVARTILLRWRANWEADAGRIESCLTSCDQLLAEPTAYMLNLKAWVLATTPDEKFYRPAEALELARRACELTQYSEADSLDTLAVCEAANGNFTEAIRLEEQAIPLAPRTEKPDCQARLVLFRKGKTYREPTPTQ